MTPDGIRPAVVHVHDGRIAAVLPYAPVLPVAAATELGDRLLLPGLVDTHVHIDEPGRTHWEGFEYVSRGAAAGGYTTLVDMPLNCLPATTSVEALREKMHAADGHCLVDYAFWGGVVPGNAKELPSLVRHGVRGFKCFLIQPGIDGFEMVTERDLEAAMPAIAAAGVPLLAHCELPAPVERAQQALDARAADWRQYATYLASRPDEAESAAIRLMIQLCRKHRCHVHVVHLSSVSALADLRAARSEGLPLTVETCPHYLACCAEEIGSGATLFKCAPPIRGRANRGELWDALREGAIDLIATDHSPCPPEMKDLQQGSFRQAWGGIASLQFALPVVWTHAQARGIPIEAVVEWMAWQPARLAHLDDRKGRIQAGYDADLVVFDPDASFHADAAGMHHRHKLTPYAGQRLTGVVETTFVRGVKVYEGGCFAEDCVGRLLGHGHN
jgi:allantoinase